MVNENLAFDEYFFFGRCAQMNSARQLEQTHGKFGHASCIHNIVYIFRYALTFSLQFGVHSVQYFLEQLPLFRAGYGNAGILILFA